MSTTGIYVKVENIPFPARAFTPKADPGSNISLEMWHEFPL